MNRGKEHIDDRFAQAAQNAKVEVPNHLGNVIFSKLASEGFSSPSSSNSIAPTTAAKTFPLKIVLYSCLATLVTGFILGWHVSNYYYSNKNATPTIEENDYTTYPKTSDSLNDKEVIPTTDVSLDEDSTTSKTPVTLDQEAPVTNSVTDDDITEPTTVLSSGQLKTPSSSKENDNQSSIPAEKTTKNNSPENGRQQNETGNTTTKNSDTLPAEEKTDSSQINNNTSPTDDSQKEKKPLLELLKEKEKRFNGQLFNEEEKN